MEKVLISSITEEENTLIRGKLNPLTEEFNKIHFQSCRPVNLVHSVSPDLCLLIINLHYYNSSQRKIITQMRNQGYLGPIVVVARASNPATAKEVQSIENVTFLEKPYDTKDLVGISRKHIFAAQVRQRVFRRYRTNQKTIVERYTKEDSKEGTVLNLSKGGAYVEGEFENLDVGELLRLQINLNEVDREYTMPARVIWKVGRENALNQTNTGIGVEFVRSDEVYKYLMNSV